MADKFFSRWGDYCGNREVDAARYAQWLNQVNQTGSKLAADGDDDGDVDQNDCNLWVQKFGFTLQLFNVSAQLA